MSKQTKFGLTIGIIFSFVAVVLLYFAFAQMTSTRNFLKTATETGGRVASLNIGTSRSTGSGGVSRTTTIYYPVVEFNMVDGQDITFVSSVGSNPSSYEVGDSVAVLYNPQNPHNAKIKSFMDLWFGVLVPGGLGAVFLLIGLVLSLVMVKNIRLKKWLQQNGQVIETDVQSCELDTSMAMNGVHPYTITSQWQNPATQTVFVFKSEGIWYNPSQFVAGKKIKVFLDPKNYKHYYMDLSTLPKQA